MKSVSSNLDQFMLCPTILFLYNVSIDNAFPAIMDLMRRGSCLSLPIVALCHTLVSLNLLIVAIGSFLNETNYSRAAFCDQYCCSCYSIGDIVNKR